VIFLIAQNDFLLCEQLKIVFICAMPPRFRVACMAAFIAAATTFLSRAADTNKVEVTKDPAELAKGERLFVTHCAACHGPNGEGQKGPTLAQPSLPRASDDASLLRIIREGIGGTEMPSARLEPKEIMEVAAFVRSLGTHPAEPVTGDAERGAQLFVKMNCAQCHTLRGKGGALGPDLTDVGRRRSVTYLRRSLLDPGADVPQSYNQFRSEISMPDNFLYVRLVPRGGEEMDGVRVNEDTFSIQIRDTTGKIHSFFKSDLVELHKEFGQSPMPSYAKTLTPPEIEDVVAYLVSLRAQK